MAAYTTTEMMYANQMLESQFLSSKPLNITFEVEMEDAKEEEEIKTFEPRHRYIRAGRSCLKKEEEKKEWDIEGEIRFAKEVKLIEYDMELGHNWNIYAARRAAGIRVCTVYPTHKSRAAEVHEEYQEWDARRAQEVKEIQEEYDQIINHRKCPERYQAQAFQAYENGVPENQIWSLIHGGHWNDAQQALERHEKKKDYYVEKTKDLIKKFSKKRTFAVDETPSRCGRRSHHKNDSLCRDHKNGAAPARFMEIGETFQICEEEEECWVEMYNPESWEEKEEDKYDYCPSGIPGRYKKWE